MSSSQGFLRSACVAVLAAAAAATLAAQGNTSTNTTSTITLSDPSRPAVVRVSLLNGAIAVRGEDRRDILVTAVDTGTSNRRRADREPAPSSDGLRQLVGSAGVIVTEERNLVTISWRSAGGSAAGLDIRVPTRTSLRLNSTNGREIVVEHVEGEIEVSHTNGGIRLVDVSGSVLAHSHNGSVTATLLRPATDRPMSFTTFNGHVDVTLPGDARALLTLRSDNGDVFTAFDDADIRTGTSSAARGVDGRARATNRTILAAINGGGPEIELRTFNGNIYLRRR